MRSLISSDMGRTSGRGRFVIGIVFSMACFSVTQPSAAVEPTDVEDAKRAFDLGVKNQARPLVARSYFSQATDIYRDLHVYNCRSPGLYRNLGNAAVLADRWPEALWAYQVGLKLDPNDKVLREHLAFVRAKVLLPPNGQESETEELWPTWLYRPSLFACVFSAALAYLLACFAGTLAVMRRSTWLGIFAGWAFLFAAAVAVGSWCIYQDNEIDHETPVVILAENTTLHQGNGVSYPPHPELPLLPRGLEARLLHRRGGWVRIRVAKKEMGWVPLERVLIVAP